MSKIARASRRESLNIRIKSGERELIDQAARLLGKSRTDFLLEAGRRAAEEALLDRTFFRVGAGVYSEFVARLDAAPKPNARLKKTMTMPAPWD